MMRFFTLFSISRYFFIFFWFRVIFVHLVPCSALVWLNYHLAVALRRADQRRRRLHDRWRDIRKVSNILILSIICRYNLLPVFQLTVVYYSLF